MYKWKDMYVNCIWGHKIFLQVKDMDLCLDLKPYWFHFVPKMGENTILLLVVWGQELLTQLHHVL